MKSQRNIQGFTLIEILLVLVIISVIIYASVGYMQQRALQLRIERASTQTQQILNAGLAYYVGNSQWPTMAQLKGNYLPPSPMRNPWGNTYDVANDGKLFYVYSKVNTVSAKGASAAAQVIAGTLPLAYTSNTAGAPGLPPSSSSPCVAADTTCYVVASVNIPGQNLNNATAVNYAGLYKHGGCVPVPTCPVSANGTPMKAQIMVVPASVSGVNDTDAGPPTSQNVYPISSFTAYAKDPSTNPAACDGGTQVPCAPQNPPATGTPTYWRACLQVVTEKGPVTSGTGANAWGQNVTLMAITRCAIVNEPSGSNFSVFSN